jgi:excisionase family DNA binding protein
VEALIEAAIERAIRRALGPYLHRLTRCEPAVYTIAQAAEVLQVSEDTVGRLVRRGTLPRVPHVDGKVLIPRRALDHLTHVEADQPRTPFDVVQLRRSTLPPAAGPSAARRRDRRQG